MICVKRSSRLGLRWRKDKVAVDEDAAVVIAGIDIEHDARTTGGVIEHDRGSAVALQRQPDAWPAVFAHHEHWDGAALEPERDVGALTRRVEREQGIVLLVNRKHGASLSPAIRQHKSLPHYVFRHPDASLTDR